MVLQKQGILDCIKQLQIECHATAVQKGFWDTDRNGGELIALIHSELSEALEAMRHNDSANLSEEMADTVIRIFDFCEGKNIDLGEALLKKMEVNKARPRKHGKEF